VSFDDQLPSSRASDLAEEAAQGSLGAWVKMNFRLLQQMSCLTAAAQQFGYQGQSLADAVANINEVSPWPLDPRPELPNLQLKRFCASLPERPYDNLVKQAGRFAE